MPIANTAAAANERLSQQVWAWLAEVPDPEVPVVSVVDLGIVRDVLIEAAGVKILVSPTYSGCPATEVIEHDIAAHLAARGLTDVRVSRSLSPPWTTAWITAAGRQKLREYGIAPPAVSHPRKTSSAAPAIHCPRCASEDTTLVSQFGSTACKAAYKCESCSEPFEYFKCI